MTLRQVPPDDIDEDTTSLEREPEQYPNPELNKQRRPKGSAGSPLKEIERLTRAYKTKIHEISAKHRQEKADWEKMMKEQTRAIHENYEREYNRLNKNYETQLEHMREMYTTQITQIMQVLKNAVDSQILTAKESAAVRQSADRTQIDEMKKWMMEEFTNKMTKYKEIMDSIDADEENKAALASGRDVSIVIGSATMHNRKTASNKVKQKASKSDESENAKRMKEILSQHSQIDEAGSGNNPQSVKEQLQTDGFLPQRPLQARKERGGLTGFFRSLGTT